MSRENVGYIVLTQNGEHGRTYHKEGRVKGKMIVHLVTQDFKPVLDEKGQQKKLLCHPDTLKIIGYAD